MSSDVLYDKYAYVTYDDIKLLNKENKVGSNLQNSNSTLLAIRAPKGSRLEIVNPDSEEEDPMY